MDARTAQLTIGKVARSAGLAIDTVRFYEREGLLDKPARTASGYRHYTIDAVARLRFIRQAKDLGFSLSEIKELLALRVAPGKSCADVKARAEAKIADVEQRIAQLNRMKRALTKLATACSGRGPTSTCPILEAMEAHELRQ
ncbi:MAG TPA: heavy metal-responsive transcriptional regulator [Burkholderiales bacterium]|nr:heavy metal-responsive transcriptional regulator [Burkholderiales bacterium]